MNKLTLTLCSSIMLFGYVYNVNATSPIGSSASDGYDRCPPVISKPCPPFASPSVVLDCSPKPAYAFLDRDDEKGTLTLKITDSDNIYNLTRCIRKEKEFDLVIETIEPVQRGQYAGDAIFGPDFTWLYLTSKDMARRIEGSNQKRILHVKYQIESSEDEFKASKTATTVFARPGQTPDCPDFHEIFIGKSYDEDQRDGVLYSRCAGTCAGSIFYTLHYEIYKEGTMQRQGKTPIMMNPFVMD